MVNVQASAQQWQERANAALEVARKYGGIDGEAHHLVWTIDQMVRILAGPDYRAFVDDARSGEDGPNTYDWNIGIAP